MNLHVQVEWISFILLAVKGPGNVRIRDVVSWRSDPFYLAFHSRIPWNHLLILNSSELSRLFLSVFLDEESAEDAQHFPCCSMASESVKCGDSCATSNHLLNDHTTRRNSNIAHLQRVDGHLIQVGVLLPQIRSKFPAERRRWSDLEHRIGPSYRSTR